MKSSLAKFKFLPLLLLFVGVFLLIAGENPKNEEPVLSQFAPLLDSTSTDFETTLSSLEDQDLPIALAVSKILEFQGLHKDSKLSSEAVERFRFLINKRLEKSTLVSFKPTEICKIKIPEREIEISGHRITIPTHFVASQKFEIADFGPQSEAGTLFPDIWANFIGETRPVSGQIRLNEKNLITRINNNRIIYCSILDLKSALAIGTHTVRVALQPYFRQ